MKFVSKAAMAAALALGTTVALTAPALAQDEEQQQPEIQVSEEFRKEAVAAQNALNANDLATAQTHITTLEGLAKNDDEKYFIASLRLPLAARQNDNAAVAKALDVLIASPRTPQTELGKYNYIRGKIALDNKDNAAATRYLNRARELGYAEADSPLLSAQLAFENNDVSTGLTNLKQAIDAQNASGEKAPESWYSLGVAKAYGAKMTPQTMTWVKDWLAAYPTKENWRKGIAIYRQGAESSGALEKGTQIDLFRLMRASDALASQSDYFQYAQLANNTGLPYETKAVIDEGRTAGAIPAGDATFNQLYTSATSSIKKEGSLSGLETRAMSGSDGKLAAQTGDAFLASGDNAQAIRLYEAALQKGGVDANTVNTRLGIAYARSGQAAQAKQAFAKVSGQPRSDVAGLWTLWLDRNSTAGASAAAATS